MQPAPKPVCVAIGVFDGVHRGHQAVLQDLLASARAAGAVAAAVTFDRHPSAVVAPDRTPPLIQSLSQRLAAIAALGLEATWLIEFTTAFSALSGEAFVRQLLDGFGPVLSVHVGDRFHFGHRRSGNVDLLRRLGPVLRFATHALGAVSLDGQNISSTRIRQAIQTGDFAAADRMLGRSYALQGRVIAGDQLGRKLGFPTANLEVRGLVLPPRGVYAVRVHGAARPAQAVVNIGVRPTVPSVTPELRVEAHLLDHDEDLYGRDLELSGFQWLRAEQRFDTLAALQDQIARDGAAARALLARPATQG